MQTCTVKLSRIIYFKMRLIVEGMLCFCVNKLSRIWDEGCIPQPLCWNYIMQKMGRTCNTPGQIHMVHYPNNIQDNNCVLVYMASQLNFNKTIILLARNACQIGWNTAYKVKWALRLNLQTKWDFRFLVTVWFLSVL